MNSDELKVQEPCNEDELNKLGIKRDAKTGRFVKGHTSGGRPKGVKNYRTKVAQSIIDSEVVNIVQGYLDLTKNEDPAIRERSLRFLLNKYTDSSIESASAEAMTRENRDSMLERVKQLQGFETND